MTEHACERPLASSAAAAASRRWSFIDGLRGIAACGVMLFHFHAHRLMDSTWAVVPASVPGMLRQGELGVAIFFVISGFVLAHSLRGRWITRQFVAAFVVRRALRLDPPYWLAIAVTLGTNWVALRYFAKSDVATASWGQVLAHLFYVQEILGYAQLYPVFWTLCHEVQFYLLLLSLVAVAQRSQRTIIARSDSLCGVTPTAYVLLMGMTAIASATGMFQWRGLCLETWYLFALGVLTHAVFTRALSFKWYAAIVLGIGLVTIDAERVEWPQKLAGIATAVTLAIGATRPQRVDWLGRQPLRFLGQISYSLYLFHGLVGYRVLSLVDRFHGNSPAIAWLGLLLACGVSIGSAAAVQQFVEQPALRWAERWKTPRDA